MEKAYNVVQAAELLGIKVRTMRWWIHKGVIHAEKLAGTRRWFILESEIERLRNGNTTTEHPE